MRPHRQFLLLFGYLIWILSSFSAAYPADGALPVSPKSVDPIENEPQTIENKLDFNSTLQERGIFSQCFPGLCCWGRRPKPQVQSPGIELQPIHEMAYFCSNDYPSIEKMVEKILDHGNVGRRKKSFFYTGLGGTARAMAGNWANCHEEEIPDGFVTFFTLTDDAWYAAQANAVKAAFVSDDAQDHWQQGLSQAFAEASSGEVYIFAPAKDRDGKDTDLKTAPKDPKTGASLRSKITWYGWEYPALTRNKNVEIIYHVDPTGDPNLQERIVLWRQGDGESEHDPLGYSLAPEEKRI